MNLRKMMTGMIAVTVLVVCAVSVAPLSARGADECGGSECHADKMSGEWVHGPVGAGMCSICHTEGDSRKQGTLLRLPRHGP
jgi:hypothetical protein